LSPTIFNPYRYAGVPDPDYEENFDTDPTSNGWTLTGSAIAYDASAKNITLDAIGAYTNAYGLKLDLQTVLSGSNLDNTKFVVQFVWTATSWTEELSYSGYHDIGVWLTKLASPVGGKNTNLAFAGGDTGGASYLRDYCAKISDDAAWDAFEIPSRSDPVNVGREWATSGIAPSTSTTVGVRMIRTATNGMKVEIYTDADFDSSPAVATLTNTTLLANVDDLRYFFIAGYLQAGGSAVNQATLDSIKIWNGINL